MQNAYHATARKYKPDANQGDGSNRGKTISEFSVKDSFTKLVGGGNRVGPDGTDTPGGSLGMPPLAPLDGSTPTNEGATRGDSEIDEEWVLELERKDYPISEIQSRNPRPEATRSKDVLLPVEEGDGSMVVDPGLRGRRSSAPISAVATALIAKNRTIVQRRTSSSRYLLWDLITTFLLVYTMIVTPFEVSFLTVKLDGLFYINRLVDLCFTFDVVLNCYRPFQLRWGEWVYNPGRILKNYFKTWLIVDVISVLPYDVIGLLMDSKKTKGLKALRLLRVLRLIKLLRVLRAGRIFHRWEASLPIDYMTLELGRFCVITLMISHWLACAWYMTISARDEVLGEVNWVSDYGFLSEGSGAFSLYMAALYWSVATLSTLGYGDVVPTTDAERTFAVIATFVGSSVYAYMIGNVCGILAGMDIRKASFYETMKALNVFMDEKKIPELLRRRLRNYFLFRKKNTILGDWQNLIVDMSPLLREEVAHHVHARWVSNVQTFKGASRDFVAALVMHLRHSTYATNEIVFKMGSEANYAYIVERGLVATSAEDKVYGKGTMFGEDMMYRAGKRAYQATTLTHAVLLLLERGRLMRLLDDFPAQKRRIRKHVVRVIFRQAVLKYVRAIKRLEFLGVEEAAHSKDFLYHHGTMPIMHKHMLKAMEDVDPKFLKRLIHSTILVQRWYRKAQARKKKREMETSQRKVEAAAIKFKATLGDIGMGRYAESIGSHLPTAESIHGATPSHIALMLMGIKFNDACTILTETMPRDKPPAQGHSSRTKLNHAPPERAPFPDRSSFDVADADSHGKAGGTGGEKHGRKMGGGKLTKGQR